MRMDIYTCSLCGEGFSVEEDKQPIACPLCESKFFEFSHTHNMKQGGDDCEKCIQGNC